MGSLGAIAQWTFGQFMGLGVALAAIYYFTLFDGGDKIIANNKQIQEQLELKRTELDKLLKAKADKEKTEQEMNLIIDQLKGILPYLPAELDQADLMRTVIDEARRVGTRNIRIQPQANVNEVERDFYDTLLIDINFESTFAEAVTFLSNLTKLPRIINIHSIEMTTKLDGGDRSILDVKATLVGYRYLDKPVTEAGDPASPGK